MCERFLVQLALGVSLVGGWWVVMLVFYLLFSFSFLLKGTFHGFFWVKLEPCKAYHLMVESVSNYRNTKTFY